MSKTDIENIIKSVERDQQKLDGSLYDYFLELYDDSTGELLNDPAIVGRLANSVYEISGAISDLAHTINEIRRDLGMSDE